MKKRRGSEGGKGREKEKERERANKNKASTRSLIFTRTNRPDLIDESIEAAVSRMQSVIELGRYIRDVKVMPIKVLK